MKLAVVINVTAGAGALALAVKTQALLIEQMGSRLHSIRLAVPRLFSAACLGAVKDEPDILVVAGGPRTARKAGQIAYEKGLPILFLPGIRQASWAKKLWNSYSLEDMIAALAREELSVVHLGVGLARNQIFFENATCGLMPHLAHVGSDFAEAETLEEDWEAAKRAMRPLRDVLNPAFRMQCDGAVTERVAALSVTANGFAGSASRKEVVTRLQPLACTVRRHRHVLDYAWGMIRAASGQDWRKSGEVQSFDCARLSMDAPGGASLTLDDDMVPLEGTVELRYLPRAVKTFTFDYARQNAYASSRSPAPAVMGRRHNR